MLLKYCTLNSKLQLKNYTAENIHLCVHISRRLGRLGFSRLEWERLR